MRKTFFTLLLAGFVSLSASAQQTVKSFPKLTMAKAPLASPAYTPSAIDDKALGTKIFATQVTDESKFRSWLSFYDKNPYTLNRIKIYENEVGYQNHGLQCGAMVGDTYYAIFGSYNQNYGGPYEWFGYEYFGTVDVRTGEFTPIKDFRVEGTNGGLVSNPVYMNQTGEQELPIVMGMSYNPADGLLYMIAKYQKDAYTNAQTRLYTVDTATGDFTLVTTLDAQIFNFCFDYDGNMYTLEPWWKQTGVDEETGAVEYTWSGTYFKEYDENFELVDGKTFRVKTSENQDAYMQYYGSMSFNYTNGDLYITCPVASDNSGNAGYDRLIKLDPNTGKYVESMTFMGGNQIVGLYVPYYAADAREAAARVADLATAPDATGNAKVQLSWTNPSKAWNGDDLTELAEVLVYRKNADFKDCALSSEEIYDHSTLVATVPAGNDLIGKAMTWKDENPNQGMNVYYIVPCRVSGEKGVPDSIRCVAGLDVPGAPTDFTATLDGANVKLTWKAPVDGKNNGYIDPAALKYDIVRNPGNTTVASDIQGTEFTDETIVNETRGKFTYTIVGKNEAGVGDSVTTAEIEAGSAPLPPASFLIKTKDDSEQWTAFEGWGGDGQMFEWAWNNTFRLITGANGGSDWAASPAFRLQKGKTYRFTSSFRNDYPNVGHTIGRYVGTAPTEEGMTNKIGEETEYSASNYYESNPVVTYEDTFTAPEDGTYYFGFKVSDNTDYDILYFYGVSVEQVFTKDLQALDLNLLGTDCVSGDNNQATVQIKNGGTENVAAGSYKVMVIQKVDGVEYGRGTVENTPAVRAGSVAEIPVTFMPMEEGEYEFAARIIFDGDEYDGNNTSEWKNINVLAYGENTPWSLVVTDGDEWEYTYFPFSNVDPTDGSQSIYTKSDFAAKGDVTNTIERIGYEYRGNDLSDALQIDNVTVWMANTDLQQFTDGNAWVDESTLTQVYNGNITLLPGSGNVLSFQLDEPFTYDPAKNLLVCVEHSGAATKMFPALWRTFNENGARNRSLRYWSSLSNKYTEKAAPVLYVGFKPNRGSGINEVNNNADAAVYFDALTGKLVLNGNRADVYDLSGKLLRTYNNVNEARPSLPAGMYIIKAHAANGKTQSVKLNIK